MRATAMHAHSGRWLDANAVARQLPIAASTMHRVMIDALAPRTGISSEAGGHRADDASGSVGCVDEPDSAARLGGAVDEEPDRQRERIAEQTRDRKDEGNHRRQSGWALDVADDQRHEREARRAGQAHAKRRRLGRAVLLALVNQAAAGDPDQEDSHDRDEDVDG